LEFKVGDYVYLKVSPMKGVHRFGVRGKLAPRYVGPYKILARRGPVAYRIRSLIFCQLSTMFSMCPS
jgi:hypothetical protein